MGEVMLDRKHRGARCLRGAGRSIVGMQIMHGKNRRPHAADQILAALYERARLDRLQIADMLAQNRTGRVRQRDRALEMAAEGEHAGAHTLRA